MIKINLKHYLYTILGFLIIIYFLYIRIFLKRMPKDLLFNIFDYSYYLKMCLLIFSILFCMLMLIINYFIYLNISYNKGRFSKVFRDISEILMNSLKNFYSFLLSYIEDPYSILSKIGVIFYDHMSKFTEALLLFITYIIRLIIVIVFLTEIFLTFKLNYFYKSLSLMVIIMLIKFLLYILKDIASNLNDIREALIIKDFGINKKTKEPITEYALNIGYEHCDLHSIIKEFIFCNKLAGYLSMYEHYYNFFNPKFNIIIYTLYLIGWLYIFYWNIIFLFLINISIM